MVWERFIRLSGYMVEAIRGEVKGEQSQAFGIRGEAFVKDKAPRPSAGLRLH
jgi:hypothetical protein